MYESHFGFHAQPFQLNPDPAFYFNSRGHGRALAYLQYGVTQSEGFIVITGEIGAGKTTLVRMLLDGLDRQKVLPAQIVSTQLESGELLQTIITAFGIPASGTSKPHLIATLEAFLTALAAQGRHALLIVDEAQNLGPHAVEELRMLSNFQLGNKALLQSFLVGQPELRRVLESPSMEQLRQRVTASYHLGPLGLEETQGYVEHRLNHVGWNGRPAFEPGAYDHLYRWTGGVPRRINRLCNRVLLACFLDGAETVTAALVERTALELRHEIGEADFTPLELPARAALAAAPDAVVAPPADVALKAVDLTLPSFDAPPVLDAGADAAPAPVGEAAGIDDDAEGLARAAEAYAAEFHPPTADLIDDVDALLAASAQHLATIAAQAQVDSQGDLEAVSQRVMAVRPVEAPVPAAVQRFDKPAGARRQGVLLCVADTASAALKFAALAKRLHEQPDGPRMVLVNPGLQAAVWPWDRMERLLPALEVGLHLGAPADAGIERVLPMIHDRVLRVIDEFQPTAMLTLGDGEGVLAAVLCARRAQLPVLRLEAGLHHASGPGSVNGALLDQLADLLFASARPLALRGLQRQGIAAERIYSIPGLLQVDALSQVWKEVSTAYGAFMRHGLPIYLGPTWSEHAGAGTPYMLAALAIDPNRPGAAGEAVDRLLALPDTDKIVWVLDRVSTPALRQNLAERPDLAATVVLVDGDAPRDAAMRERMDQARVLCRQVDSLPDQLSLLRGASWAALQTGQVLADAADLLDVPCLLAGPTGWLPASAVGTASAQAFGDDAAGQLALARWVAAVAPATLRDALPEAGGATEAVQSHLRAWLARRQASATVAVPLAA